MVSRGCQTHSHRCSRAPHADHTRRPARRRNHRRAADAPRRLRQRARLSARRHRHRPGGAAADHRRRCDRLDRQPRRGDAAVPDRPGGPAAASVGHAARGVRAGHGAGGDHRRGAGGTRACDRRRLAGRDRARRRPCDVVHRDRAADAGRARPAHQPRRPRRVRRAVVPGPCVHPAGRTGAAACRRQLCPTTCPGYDVARAAAVDRRHPDRRALPAARRCSAPSAARRRRRCSPPSRC